MVNVGLLIEQKLNELNISKSEFARRLGIANQNVNRLLTHDSIDTDKLFKVGEALGYNFFTDLADDAADSTVSLPGSSVVSGDHSAAAVNGNATVMGADGAAVLEERIRSLEEQARQKDLLIQQRDLLIAEKERLIRVLLNGRE